MERTNPDRAATRRHLEGARAALRDLGSLAAVDGGAISCEVVRSAVRTALSELDGLGQLVAPEVAEVQRVACPFCANMVMPAATLCGFCWRKLTPREKA